MYSQFLLQLAKSQAVQHKITVYSPRKNIDPLYNGESDKMHLTLISYFVSSNAHVLSN